MNLFKRIKNLWKISEYEVWDKKEFKEENHLNLKKQATIIDLTPPIDIHD